MVKGTHTSPHQERLLIPKRGGMKHEASLFLKGSLATFGNCRAVPWTSGDLQDSGDTLLSLWAPANCPPTRFLHVRPSDWSLRVSRTRGSRLGQAEFRIGLG